MFATQTARKQELQHYGLLQLRAGRMRPKLFDWVNCPQRPDLLRFAQTIAAAALVVFLFISPAAGQEATPQLVVEQFHSILLDTMKRADSLGIKGRYRNLEPRIVNSFDFRLMVAIASGRHWRKADTGQRDRLTKAFTRFSIGTYASRFSSFSGESFAIAGVENGPRRTVLVKTKLIRSNDSPVAITYVMKKSPAAWRIVDVIVDGSISELAVLRSEYASTLKRGGPDALIGALNKKAGGLVDE